MFTNGKDLGISILLIQLTTADSIKPLHTCCEEKMPTAVPGLPHGERDGCAMLWICISSV